VLWEHEVLGSNPGAPIYCDRRERAEVLSRAMSLRNLVIVALLICAFGGVITAIADKGKGEPATAADAAKAAPVKKKPAAKTAFHGRTVYVGIRSLAFAPKTIRLRVGDRVVWRNRDNVGHNVTTQEDPAGTNLVDLASPTIPTGGAYAYVARYVGNALYVCTIHPTTMQAHLVVTRRS
jgi:plastocyanin